MLPGIGITRPDQRNKREELIGDPIHEKHQGQKPRTGCVQRPDIGLQPTEYLTRQKALSKGASTYGRGCAADHLLR